MIHSRNLQTAHHAAFQDSGSAARCPCPYLPMWSAPRGSAGGPFSVALFSLHLAQALFQRGQIGMEPVESACVSGFSDLHRNKFVIYRKIAKWLSTNPPVFFLRGISVPPFLNPALCGSHQRKNDMHVGHFFPEPNGKSRSHLSYQLFLFPLQRRQHTHSCALWR